MVWSRLADPLDKVGFVYGTKAVEFQKTIARKLPPYMNLRLLIFHYGIATMRNNFIYKVTENATSYLVDFGIPQYFLKYINENVLKGFPPETREPKKFSWSDLEFGFVIHLICCGISILVFVVEILYFNVRNLIGLQVFLVELKFQ